MKIQILSDVHNEFSVLPIPETDANVVVLAGDIDVQFNALEWAKQFNKPVLYVLGNHEFYGGHIESTRLRMRELTQGTNISFLDDDEAVIQGVRFLGSTLWTDFKLFGGASSPQAMLDAQFGMSDYKVIKSNEGKLLPQETARLHEKSLQFLKNALNTPFEGKTVVVTHHAPSMQSIAPIYYSDKLTPGFASNLDEMIGPPITLWIHGHTHNSSNYELNGTQVVANPRGYQYKNSPRSENRDFDPKLVIEL